LDKVGGRPTGPTLRKGGGKDQCDDPRTQTEEKYHTNPRTSQRDTEDEEYVGITYHYENTEIGASSSNRTTTGMGRRNNRTGRRR
jgi:hypothetical protein